MRAAKAMPKMMDLHHFGGGLRTFLDAQTERREPSAALQFIHDAAVHGLELAAVVQRGGSENEREMAARIISGVSPHSQRKTS